MVSTQLNDGRSEAVVDIFLSGFRRVLVLTSQRIPGASIEIVLKTRKPHEDQDAKFIVRGGDSDASMILSAISAFRMNIIDAHRAHAQKRKDGTVRVALHVDVSVPHGGVAAATPTIGDIIQRFTKASSTPVFASIAIGIQISFHATPTPGTYHRIEVASFHRAQRNA